MKTFHLFICILLWGISSMSSISHAEDIDIYSGSASSGLPNVLLVMDNGANFSASAATCSYASGGVPTLNGTAAGIEQCALVDTIEALPDDSVNIGLMTYNANGFASDVRAPNDLSYHEVCNSTQEGGCLLRELTQMSAGNKQKFVDFIKSWKTDSNTNSTRMNIKVNNDQTAAAMQEAWAYYNGKIGMSGKQYSTNKLGVGCQKNFIIFIGNAFGTSGTPGDSNNPSPYDGPNALTSGQVGATTEQKQKIIETINFKSSTCGVTSFSTTHLKADNWGDEWARLMYQQDGSPDLDGTQNIVTYTIGTIDNSSANSCRADYPALLTSMANYGGGKYFQASNSSELKEGLLRALNEIQSVDSVFSSASLPVSITAQGTYLNQIFLGMFRPDGSGNPRWLGNLKQYQFILEGTDPNTAILKLGDANKQPALSNAGTGFLSPNAVSFWTKKDLLNEPDLNGGFFRSQPNPKGHDHFDLPDGELVERGAAAQRMRLDNLTADFSATAGTASNPRRLFTYCPAGFVTNPVTSAITGCVPSLKHASNAFSIKNVNISGTDFGDSTVVTIASIVRTGTVATVTTTGAHGFVAGTTSVEIRGADQAAYSGTHTVATTPTPNSFTFTGLPDRPNSPSQNAYIFSTPGSSPVSVVLSRTTDGTPNFPVGFARFNAETVAVTSTANHGFSASNTVTISGATPANYNGNWTIALPATGACPAATCFTYEIPVTPLKSVTGFSAVVTPPVTPPPVSSINKVTGVVVSTIAHGFHVGQLITFSGTTEGKYDGKEFAVLSVLSDTSFTFNLPAGAKDVTNKGNVKPSTTAVTGISLSRAASTITETVTATGAPSNAFGRVAGDTKRLNISKVSATSGELAYVASNALVTCQNSGCTQFSYGPIATSPSTTISGPITASLATGGATTIAAGNISRSGTTVTVTGATPNLFGSANGATATVNMSLSGADAGNESAYLGNGSWTIACANGDCSTFTFGPVVLDPASPATTVNGMKAIAVGTPPDRNMLVKWVRGEDNFGDELSPKSPVAVPPITVRPSIHGDVLHSRPVIVNYGDSRGLVVFYGANDGLFRAVNGSQTASIAGQFPTEDTTPVNVSVSVPPGGELWGLVLPEHFSQFNRQRVNSPELKLTSTPAGLIDAKPKDYFVDGSFGIYQKLCGSTAAVGSSCYDTSTGGTSKGAGIVDKAYLYLTMRRGGRFIYALDVSDPTDPKVMWKISSSDTGFGELGQTWSRPRVTLVKGYSNPVLVFGAGYDVAEDAEPPTTGTMGRGVFVVDAVSGVRVWSATHTAGSTACTGTSTQAACSVAGMNWAIPADISFVDRDNDGKTDRFYASDLGGNVWRMDLEPTAGNTADKWQVSKLAALGCSSGVCGSGTTPRKFFFPPNVVSVGATGASGSYDAVLLGSGDREHPLQSSGSFGVTNRFYALKDTATGMNASGTVITETNLFNGGAVTGTTITYDGTLSGFYKTFDTGEKSVNASVTTKGTTFFGTNKPTPPSATSCRSNLGEAKGYALNPFTGTFNATVFDGGGLPPTPTVGIVTIVVPGTSSSTGTGTVTTPDTTVQKAFCMGCGSGSGVGAGGGSGGGSGGSAGGDSNSALGAKDVGTAVPKNPRRTYWYKK